MFEILFFIVFLDNYQYEKVNTSLLIVFLVFNVIICLLLIPSYYIKNFEIEHSMRFEIKYTLRFLLTLFLILTNIFIISLAFRSLIFRGQYIFTLIAIIYIILSIGVLKICIKTIIKFVLLKRAKLIVDYTNFNKLPKCPNCKKENPDKSKICVHCGIDFVDFINAK